MSHHPETRAQPDAADQPSIVKPTASDVTSDRPNGSGTCIRSSLQPPSPADLPTASDSAPAASFQRLSASDDLHRSTSRPQDAAEPSAASEREPKKKRSFLNIPRSTSQSNDEQTPTGTGLSGATVADSESVGRGSKRSFLGKRRAGSTASSKRSQHAATSAAADQPPPVPAAENREGSTRSKTKKSGGLLACLPCFAPKDSTPAGETTENVKKVEKVQPTRTTQPAHKIDPTAESSTADSKEPLDEKSAGEALGANRDGVHSDGTANPPSTDALPKIVTRSSSKKQAEQSPLPQPPSQPGTLQTGPAINVQGPTPGTTPVQPRPSHEQEQIIHDRTESQEEKDHDIEMNDVPIATTDIRHDGDESSDAAHDVPPKIDLPPAPPLEQREKAVRDQTSDTSMSEPQQKYLLGPIRPEFKGKKCLVLDLDETLVHSSFKVGIRPLHTVRLVAHTN